MRRLLPVLSAALAVATAAAADWRVLADGREVPVERMFDIAYAVLPPGPGPVVRVEATGALAGATLSPTRRAPAWREAGPDAREFVLGAARHLVVTAPGRPRLFLFARREAPPPAGARDGRDFGLDPTGARLVTAELQRAIDETATARVPLRLGPGLYRTGTLRLPSHTDLWLDAGAVIQGSARREDYPVDPGRRESDQVNDPANATNNGERMTFSRLILVDGAAHVRVRGAGMIRGGGAAVRDQGRPANLVRIRSSRDVMFEDVFLADPSAWNTHILHSERVTFRGVRILNDPNVLNTDGIDPDSSSDVLIEDCFLYCSDDCVAIKTSNNGDLLRDSARIEVRGNVMLTKKSAMKLGTETKAARMHDIEFTDNDVVVADRFFSLYCSDGAAFEDVRFRRNHLEAYHPDNYQCAFHFRIVRRGGAGRIQGVLVEDTSLARPAARPSRLEGLDATHRVSGVVFRGVSVAGRPVRAAADLPLQVNEFVEPVVFEP